MKKLLSQHAKVMPLPATRRVLVIDAVANLRLVSAVLNEERQMELRAAFRRLEERLDAIEERLDRAGR